MKLKFFFVILFFFVTSNIQAKSFDRAYFAGGCFWCMEESFDEVEGVLSTVSGYSGNIWGLLMVEDD